jgi:hypothetical protein
VTAWPALAAVARDRLAELDADARAAVVDLLRERSKIDTLTDEERELCGWAADADEAAPLRDRWARTLAARVREVTAPVLAWDDALELWFELEGRRIMMGSRWARWARTLGGRRLATRRTVRHGAARTPVGQPLRARSKKSRRLVRLPRPKPPVDAADSDALAAGLPLVVAAMLAELQPGTRAKVRAMIDAGEGWGAAGTAGMGGPTGSAWAWLGGAGHNEPDDGPVCDGWRRVARWGEPPDRWRAVSPVEPPRYLRALALDRWAGGWRAEAEERRARASKVPALTVRALRAVVDLSSSAGETRANDDRLQLWNSGGQLVAELPYDALPPGIVADAAMLREQAPGIVRAAQSMAGVYVLWHAMNVVTRRARMGLEQRERWPSWTEWAEEVAELGGVKLDSALRRGMADAAWTGNCVQLRLFGDRYARGLWTLEAPDPRKRGRPSKAADRSVLFSYAPILEPAWATREADRGRGVRLVAMPDRPIAAHVRDPGQRAPAVLFSMLTLAEVCELSSPAYVDDGAALEAGRVRALAGRAGLRPDAAGVQLSGLVGDGLLIKVEADRYALGAPDARALLAGAGKRWEGRREKVGRSPGKGGKVGPRK